MHPNLKNEETIDEVAPLAIPLIGKGISALAGAGAAYYAGKQVLQGNTGIDVLSKTNRYIQGLKKAIIAKPVTTKQEPATVSRETEKPAGVPSPVDVPAPTTATVTPRDIAADKPQTQQIPGAAVPVATGAKPEDKTQAQTTVPAAVAVPLAGAAAGAGAAAQTRAATKATAATKAAERTATAPSRPARGVPLPFGGSGGASDNSAEIFNRSHVPSRISIPHKRRKAHFEETRYDIKNVARPENSRDEEIVGRPRSKYKLSKQAEIIRKVVEEQKIIIKKDKEEKMGKNPLVDTEPKLKHHTLDQESAK
jgi:hypothetical protein